ncbi:hypothetical protein [Tepidibacter aestuarii]|uniref:hypothetical protein n=1 Tax=Tepidibacter aestuarii TaxID=2925782 RepID=UPI0020BF84CE|nr:hypothetical protein [Tepidibacter aestuarii]CAH2213354.1 conserved protein of unknown function [Tepidibacter aestuarii]
MKEFCHLIVKFKNKIDLEIREELYSQINIYKAEYNNLYLITLEEKIEGSKGFEHIREEYISVLTNLNAYVSILYDSISVKRHKDISNTIYELERSLRNLIEIVFLDNRGIDWFKIAEYQNNDKRDRRKNRAEFVTLLENPLDDLDFKQLNKFLTDTIAVDNEKTMVKRLDELINKVDNLSEMNIKNIESLNECVEEIRNLKDIITNKKKKSFKADEIFLHINEKINSEWKTLYNVRNLWAHNNCIITKDEFDAYKILSKSVLNKIDTEITLLIFFNENDTNILLDDNSRKIIMRRYPFEGIEECKFEFIIKDGEKSLIIVKENFNYKFFDAIIDEVCADQLSSLKNNPFILYKNKSILEIFINKLKDFDIDEIKDIFKKSDIFEVKEEEGDLLLISKEIDNYLNKIF